MSTPENYASFINETDDDSHLDRVPTEEECRIAREKDANAPVEDFSRFYAHKAYLKTERNYKAYIAGNKESRAFDSAIGKTKESAIATVKRRNSPDWKDCCIWCVYVHDNGQEEKV